MAREKTIHAVESKKTKMINAVIFILLLVLAALTVYPVVYIILGSFKTNSELVSGGLNILPEKFVLDNYIQAWNMGEFFPVYRKQPRIELRCHVRLSGSQQYGGIRIFKAGFSFQKPDLQCDGHVYVY